MVFFILLNNWTHRSVSMILKIDDISFNKLILIELNNKVLCIISTANDFSRCEFNTFFLTFAINKF